MQQAQQFQKQIALAPADPLGARFCEYFNHGWHFIYAKLPTLGEKAKWLTETRYPLEPRNLWEEYQAPDLLGLRFPNDGTRYALADVDRGSSYHPANDSIAFNSLLAAFEAIGLCRSLVVCSSDSKGLHIYFFLPESLPTFNLACAMRFAVEDAGFIVQGGQLEIFPNVKAYSKHKPTDYNGHRLPLQAGSYWLDEDFEPLTNDLERFLDAADLAADHQDLDALKEAIAAAAKRPKSYVPETSARASIWKRHLEKRISDGWMGSSQTNDLLKDIVTYGKVFKHLSGEALVDYVVNTAINAPDYQQHCHHQHEIYERARQRAGGTERNRYYSPYPSYPDRVGTYKQTFGEQAGNNVIPFKRPWVNQRRAEQAHERITRAVEALEGLGQFPVGIRAREGAIVAKAKELSGIGVSRVTLHKHLNLWHPAHYNTKDVLQAKSLLQADSSVCPTPPPCSTQENSLSKSLEPLPQGNSSDVSYTPPLMKVNPSLVESEGGENSKSSSPLRSSQSTASPNSLSLPLEDSKKVETISNANGCSTSGARVSDDKPTLSMPPVAPEVLPIAPEVLPTTPTPAAPEVLPIAPEVPSAAPMPADLKTRVRLTRLRVEAKSHSQKAVRQQALHEKRFFSREDRERREAIAKFQFFWRSGEETLQREATEWAINHPEDLPEALLSVAEVPEVPAVVSEVPIFAKVTSAALEVTSAALEVTSAALEVPAVVDVPLPAVEVPPVVGDCVVWDNCPGHCAWMNPFRITAIEGDMVRLDFYENLVPLSQLRRCSNG